MARSPCCRSSSVPGALEHAPAGIKKGLQQDCNPNFLTWCRGRDLNPHGIATAPSRQRVYQFHHLDAKRVLTRKGRVWQAKNDGFAKFVSSLCHSGEKLACSRDCKAHNTRSGSQGTDSGQIFVPCPVPFPVPFASCTGPGNAHALRKSPTWALYVPAIFAL